MQRPFLLRVLPLTFRQIVWSRFYRPTSRRFFGLFDAAPLHFAPEVAMKLLPGDVISDSIAFTGIYDLHLTRWLLRIAREDAGVFVDVGANLGYFSLLWAARHEQNRAMAFEASPRIVDLLEHNVRENGLGERISVHGQAVGAGRGSIQFDSGPAEQTGWGGFVREASAGSITLDVVPLDEVLADLPNIAVMMIDIQGADFWALQGAERILRERRVRHIMWEENKDRMQQLGIPPGKSQQLMQDFGYKPVPQGDPQAGVLHWYAHS